MHSYSPRFYSTFFQMRRLVIVALAIIMCVASARTAVAQDTEESTEDAVAIFNQAQELHEKGDLAAAVELYKKALKVVPEFPEAEYQCGSAYLGLGKRPEAEASFRRAIAIRPDWTLALSSLGSLLIETGNFREAETHLTNALKVDDQSFPAMAALAELRLKTKAPASALAELLTKIEAFTRKAKPTAGLWSARAALEIALGKAESARTSLNNALALEPRNKFALSELARLALSEGDTIRASEAVATLEKIDPESVATKLLRARVHAAYGRSDEALRILDTFGDTDKEVVEFRNKVRMAGSENVSDLEKLLAADPGNATILGRLCTLYRVDSPAKALDYCRKASEAEPANINHAIGFGAALVQAKMYDQAVGLFRKVIAIAPDNSTSHANLATALFQSKRYAEAKIEYQWLVSRQPDLAAAYYFLGITHDQLAEYLDAMANYQQFLRLADPSKSGLEIDKVKLRLPILQKQIKDKKGK
ncbi:MAG: tetratricopeptide repeat protein [Pyrinomonadaceae bacterium]|nr:tetratricopeptide repeat protein [Pyrinomonadaceae bacterium]MBP6212599.1 tetratricopeptide repeat protein [Pyrinomonadaceae bacterium]